MYKLLSLGIEGKYFKVLKNMYENAKSRVKWDSELGKIFENLRGVLQGGVLSPSLFKLFLSDISDYLDKNKGVTIGDIIVCYILFADDLLLISETSTGLQKLINGLENYCFQWQILVNLTKTKISVFNAQYVNPNAIDTFYFNKTEITKTNVYEYVGLMFSTNSPKFQANYQNVRSKSLRAIYMAKKLMNNTIGKNASISTQFKMFDSQIRPILEYGCEIWYSGCPIKILESVHTEFMKRALGVKKQTSNLAIYGETGRFPLELRQMELQLRYWCRLAAMMPDDPLYHVYHQLLSLHKVGIKTWCDNIKHSLDFLGLRDMWSAYINGTPFKQILPVVSNVKEQWRINTSKYGCVK